MEEKLNKNVKENRELFEGITGMREDLNKKMDA